MDTLFRTHAYTGLDCPDYFQGRTALCLEYRQAVQAKRAFACEQVPHDVDVGEIVIRPTAQA